MRPVAHSKGDRAGENGKEGGEEWRARLHLRFSISHDFNTTVYALHWFWMGT